MNIINPLTSHLQKGVQHNLKSGILASVHLQQSSFMLLASYSVHQYVYKQASKRSASIQPLLEYLVPFLQHRPGERQAGSVTIRHVPSRQGAGRGPGPAADSLPEREVCNCISCGKIYFTRSDTVDTITFLGASKLHVKLSTDQHEHYSLFGFCIHSHSHFDSACQACPMILGVWVDSGSGIASLSSPKGLYLPSRTDLNCRVRREMHFLWCSCVTDAGHTKSVKKRGRAKQLGGDRRYPAFTFSCHIEA